MKTRIASNINHKKSVAILNELFAKLDCSLALYLSYARPWVPRRNMLLEAVVRRLSYEHEVFASNIARLISDRRGSLDSCVFPMGFMSFNDLSLEYLAPRVLDDECGLIVTAEDCAERLKDDPEARRVVRKNVASLRRYAALLAELLAPNRVKSPTATDEDGTSSLRGTVSSWTATERFNRHTAEPQTAA
jgi:hypothetical protein